MDVNAAFFSQNKPFILQNCLNKWKILQFEKEKWCQIFQGTILSFRKSENCLKDGPRWESTCSRSNLTFEDFLKISEEDQKTSLYYDYKYINDVFEADSFLSKVWYISFNLWV